MRLIALLLTFSLSGSAARLAFVDATVVDGTGRPPYQATVLVSGDRVADVVERLDIPADYKIIDARGKTLLPGLFDLHTHLTYSAASRYSGDWPQHLAAYLYAGVTSAVEFGSYPEQFEPMRKLLADGTVQGPRIHFAARLAPPYGHGLEGGRGDYFSREVYTPEDALAVMKELEQYKPDAVKLFTDGWRYGYADPMASMTAETIQAATEAAHTRGWEVLTHTVTANGAEDAASGGVDVIAHGVSNAPVTDKLIELIKDNGVTYAPTLAVYHPKGRDILDDLLDAVVPPGARAKVRPPLRAPEPTAGLVGTYDDPESPRARRWKNLVANNRTLHEDGVFFGVGTDAGVSNTWHGWSTQRELRLLVYAGLSPLEALTAATGNSAKALNVDDERGTIEKGKLADLILVGGKPHERIEEIAKLERVWLGGREIDRAGLKRLMAQEEPTPLPARKPPALLDDFELEGRRSRIGTNWTNATDSGLSRSEIRFQKTLESPGDQVLTILARMANEDAPWASVNLPLTPGKVTPADLTEYRGVEFQARGDGVYRLLIETRRNREYDYPSADFRADAKQRRVRVSFADLGVDPFDATSLMFRIEREPGALAWLELDDIRLY